MKNPATQLEQDEPELIARIKSGEKELFYDLIRPHQRSVFIAALAILRNEADAEDAAQEAILKAFTRLEQFRGDSKFGTWLVQVAVNEARMRRRKDHLEIMKPLEDRRNEEGEFTPQDFTDWREIPSETLERKQVRRALANALASLPEKYREVFILRDVKQLSIEETAQALGITEATVKTRLLRARLMLRDLLAPGLGGSWSSRPDFRKGENPWT
jgi:RNA polymerase sigma-70 factor (ECF subfamily)